MIPYVAAVIVAAGNSTRMGQPKQAILLGEMPVLARTLLAFDRCEAVGEIAVVTRAEDIAQVEHYAAQYGLSKVCAVCAGGETRQQSVQNGVEALSGTYPLLAIHDGARPLITPKGIETVAAVAQKTGAATAAVRAVDTIKVADETGTIIATPDRSTLWQVQTPQIFETAAYRAALAGATGDFTDDCQLMERAGYRVRLVEPGCANFKLTVPDDVAMARAVLQERGDL